MRDLYYGESFFFSLALCHTLMHSTENDINSVD